MLFSGFFFLCLDFWFSVRCMCYQLKEDNRFELGARRSDYITCHHGKELFQARASDGYGFYYILVDCLLGNVCIAVACDVFYEAS